MNRKVVLFHLREAAEQLGKTIQSLADEKGYGTEQLRVEMSHLYHHINTAWNGRNQTIQQYENCTDEDFSRFRKFPTEKELLLD